jgi:hypothetical protein
MFGGVRRQVRRMLRGSAKLWVQTAKSPWPGPDPEHLPAMVGFRPERVARKNVDSAKGRVELTAPDH